MHRPWSARHASRIPKVGARAEARVGTATSALASTSVFFRPQRSDSGPQTHAPAARTRITIDTVSPACAALTPKSRDSSGRIACVEYMTANIPAAPMRKPASAARVWPIRMHGDAGTAAQRGGAGSRAASTCVTGAPVILPARRGRSICSQRETRPGSVETMTSS